VKSSSEVEPYQSAIFPTAVFYRPQLLADLSTHTGVSSDFEETKEGTTASPQPPVAAARFA
jgi:hypothetical protein